MVAEFRPALGRDFGAENDDLAWPHRDGVLTGAFVEVLSLRTEVRPARRRQADLPFGFCSSAARSSITRTMS